MTFHWTRLPGNRWRVESEDARRERLAQAVLSWVPYAALTDDGYTVAWYVEDAPHA